MLEMLMQWYRRRFSDPEAIALLVILVAGFGIIFFFSGLLAPLLVAIVLAYLLEWPTVRLQSIGCSRRWATSIVLVVFVGILLLMAFVVLPIAWQQGIYLIRDMPGMLNKLSDFAATLPRRYPALMDAGIIDAMAENMRSRMLTMGDSVVKISLASLVGLLTIAVYLVLVPLMVFFLLKYKIEILLQFFGFGGVVNSNIRIAASKNICNLTIIFGYFHLQHQPEIFCQRFCQFIIVTHRRILIDEIGRCTVLCHCTQCIFWKIRGNK